MLKRRQQGQSNQGRTRSFIAEVREWLTVLAIIAGGAWAGVAFFWDRLIAPRFERTLVQVSSSSSVVGRTDCCVLVEIETTLRNAGRRDAHIPSSHFVTGAKNVGPIANMHANTIGALNRTFERAYSSRPPAAKHRGARDRVQRSGPTRRQRILGAKRGRTRQCEFHDYRRRIDHPTDGIGRSGRPAIRGNEGSCCRYSYPRSVPKYCLELVFPARFSRPVCRSMALRRSANVSRFKRLRCCG